MTERHDAPPRQASEYFDANVPEEGYTPVVAVARAKAILDMGLGFDKPWALAIIKGLMKGLDERTPRSESEHPLVTGDLAVQREIAEKARCVAVPPNPTHSMLAAGRHAIDNAVSSIMLDVAYRAMLDAFRSER